MQFSFEMREVEAVLDFDVSFVGRIVRRAFGVSARLAGYRGLAAHEAEIPFRAKYMLAQAVERIVTHFQSRNMQNKVREWRKKLPRRTAKQPAALNSKTNATGRHLSV